MDGIRVSKTGSKTEPTIRIIDETDGINNSANASANINGIPIVDPTSSNGTDGNNDSNGTAGESKRRRGRPKGSKNRNGNTARYKVETDNSATLETIQSMLFGVHLMAATSLGVSEIAITEDEAEKLTKAIANVAQYYDVSADPKTLAWWNLACVAGGIYFTRGVAIYNNRKKRAPVLVIKPEAKTSATPQPQKTEPPKPQVKVPSKQGLNPSDVYGGAEPDYDLNVGEM